ncbi:MAG: hypothetical protein GY854_32275 [Deltaproteobacteria bacterium]|nr:hypothetical protein [Deltaproteobacteria bacterium]
MRIRFRRKLLQTAVAASLVLLTATASAGVVANKSGEFYSVKVETSKKGDETLATITATGKSGYHCNKLYPWKLTFVPGDGKKQILKKKDAKKFAEEAVIFTIPYTPAAGKKTSVKLKLSMCDDKQCKMETVSFSW